jgi:hypothetical protein
VATDCQIGRLPATNLEQARVLLDKVLAYENGGWNLNGPAALVADNSDYAGTFEADAEWLAAGVLAERDPENEASVREVDSVLPEVW